MKLLLTSGGLANDSMVNALAKLVERPFNQLNAVFIPTAANAEIKVSGDTKWLDMDINNARKLNFKNFELVDLDKLSPEQVKDRVTKADVIFMGGGNSFYLSYWMEKSGLFDLLPELLKTRVYVGISAGSMAVTDSLRVASQALEKEHILSDDEYEELGPKGESSAKTAKLVNFVIRPHLNSEYFPKIRLDFLAKIAQELNVPMYAIDDQTAIMVKDGKIEIISEGVWKKFN